MVHRITNNFNINSQQSVDGGFRADGSNAPESAVYGLLRSNIVSKNKYTEWIRLNTVIGKIRCQKCRLFFNKEYFVRYKGCESFCVSYNIYCKYCVKLTKN